MISNLAKKLTATLIKSKQIDEREQELYEYGFFIFLSNTLFVIVTILTGIALKTPFQGLIFFVTFSIIRQYAGGYHAKTETKCTLFSTILIVVCMISIKLLSLANSFVPTLIVSLAGAVLIAVFAPLDSPEKPLDKDERERFKIITILLLFIVITCILLCFSLNYSKVVIPSCIGICAEAFLILLGKISKSWNTRNQIIN